MRNLFSMEPLKKIIVEQVVRAERDMFGAPGSEKRAAVVDSTAGMIDIPLVPNFIEMPIKRAVIGYLVDKAVEKLNLLVGYMGFSKLNLREGDAEKIAAVVEAPIDAAIDTVPATPGRDIDDRLAALYEKYGIEAEPDFSEEDGAATPAPVAPSPARADENWDRAIAFVFLWEGGYVNHPADRGGETNMGITAATLAAAHAKGIVGHNVVRNLTRDEAARIYKINYWDNYWWGNIAWPACLALLDATVHHGGGGMARLAQRTCNDMGAALAVDGKWGPLTRAAVGKYSPDAEFSRLFLEKRRDFFDAIIKNNPSQEVFRNGWYRRIGDLAKEIGVRGPV